MALSSAQMMSMAFGSSTFLRGRGSKLEFGKENPINKVLRQSKNSLFRRDNVESELLQVASHHVSTAHGYPAGKAIVSALTKEETLPTEGRFAEWKWNASPSSAQQWLNQPLNFESILRNLQPANARHSSTSPPLSIAAAADCKEDVASLISRRLPNLPKPLSIKGLTARSTKTSTSLRVAHPGAAGAHSESAAIKAHPDCQPFPCGKFEASLEAVEHGLADRAVIPIENSVGGSVHKNYDLLLRHRLNVIGEVQLPVRQCLLALPGKAKGDLKRVLSHPQALSQCEHNLRRLGVTAEAVNDTATAAQLVATNSLEDTGAISSSAAAKRYGLEILDSDFQDYSGNTTRFMIVAREPLISDHGMEKNFKTSIVCALENDCEDLFRALSVFALRNINLLKIESRPRSRKVLKVVDKDSRRLGEKVFDHLFYMDFEASMDDRRAQNALKELQEVATFLRVLGSYPTADNVPSSS